MSDRRLLAPPDEITSLLDGVAHLSSLPDRLEALSAAFLGRPYHSFPLVGSHERPEELVTSLDGFDCVTFAESVLALGWSRQPDDFARHLVAIRYRQGHLDWAHRNHYMHDWIRQNVRAQRVSPVLPSVWVWGGKETRQLDLLPHYPTFAWRPRYFPSRRVGMLAEHGRKGDVLCFVSNKKNLDTFHVGLLVPPEQPSGQPAVRHASRSAGQVIHQDLREFLTQNDVPGMLIVPPLPRGDNA
jgi:hypothetical protein